MKEKLFVHGGKRIRNKSFDYLAPIGKEELKAVTEVVKHKKLSGFYKDFLGGEKVRKFEKKFAEYIGVKHAITVNSGTSALYVALAASGIGPGDEVVVPPFSFTATAPAVLMNNAIPVFVDIEPETFCIDPKKIRDAITEKTKAIIPVHIYGKVANMDEIKDVIASKNITIIEDACQAPGCLYKEKKVGSIGDSACFSFVETKNLVIGEGGMITTDNDDIAERCRLIRNHGEVWMEGKPRRYLSNMLGFNFRLTEIQAAIGIEQLKKLDSLNDVRRKNAAFLEKELKSSKGLDTLQFNEEEICHVFPILFSEEKVDIPRKRFIEVLGSEGIPLSYGYPRPLYKNPIFREMVAYGDKGCPYSCRLYDKRIDYKNIKCDVAEDICQRLVCITQIHYPFDIRDMKDIINAIKKVLDNKDKLR